MKLNNKKYLHITINFILILFVTKLYSAVRPTEEDGPPLPPIWEEAGPRERLKAVRAAELDADRLLAERIFGLQIDSETTVQDLAAEDDSIAGAVRAVLVGAVTTEGPDFLPDGQVQVVRAVKIREIIETLNRVIKGKKLSDGSFITTSDKSKVDRRVEDRVIDVMGNAALPHSEGHQKIMAKRAAELDAYRRLAGRMLGMQIDSTTTVRDMALENDRIVASLSHVLKAATPTAIKYNRQDGSCAVTMEIKTADIIRTIKRYANKKGTRMEIQDEIEEKVFTETGYGAMRDASDSNALPTNSSSPGQPFFETEMILKEVIQTGPVVQ